MHINKISTFEFSCDGSMKKWLQLICMKQDSGLESVAKTQSLMNYRVLWSKHIKDRAQHSESDEKVLVVPESSFDRS